MGLHTKVRWNDGEGLNSDDLTTATVGAYAEFIEALSPFSGAEVANAIDARYSATIGGTIVTNQISTRNERVQLPTGKLFTPHPMAPLVCVSQTMSATGAAPQEWYVFTSAVYIGPGTCVMSRGDATGSVAPGMSSSSPLVYVMSSLSYDLGAALVSTAASILSATHGSYSTWRFDTLAVKLDNTVTYESRDFEDAVTRTLTTVSTPKVDYVTCTFEYASGSVAAGSLSSGAPSISSGYAPLVTVGRFRDVTGASDWGVADPADAWRREQFYYHAYPMRYACETVFPKDFLQDDAYDYLKTATNGVFPDGLSLNKAGTITGTHYMYAVSRRMHEGCRLIGITHCAPSAAAEVLVASLGAVRWASDGEQPGVWFEPLPLASSTSGQLHSITGFNSRILNNANTEGAVYIGELDWSPSAPYPVPVWGNGTTYGPLFSTMQKNWATFDVSGDFSHGEAGWLAIRYSMTNTNYAIGPIKFHYLY